MGIITVLIFAASACAIIFVGLWLFRLIKQRKNASARNVSTLQDVYYPPNGPSNHYDSYASHGQPGQGPVNITQPGVFVLTREPTCGYATSAYSPPPPYNQNGAAGPERAYAHNLGVPPPYNPGFKPIAQRQQY